MTPNKHPALPASKTLCFNETWLNIVRFLASPLLRFCVGARPAGAGIAKMYIGRVLSMQAAAEDN
jgi:hypothetical protein